MSLKKQTINCTRCGGTHSIKLDYSKLSKAQRNGIEPVINDFECPDAAFMYRVGNWAIDTRANLLKLNGLQEQKKAMLSSFRTEWGEKNFETKISRFLDLNPTFLGVPEEYYDLLSPVIASYCCGYFYPAMTGAGALGERILNRLVILTRDYHKDSAHYKKLYRKSSFDQWEYPIEVLSEWGVISVDVAEILTQLKRYRNESIHYNYGYDFEVNSKAAVSLLMKLIDGQFNYLSRKDLFWIFTVPGEVWVRTSVEEQSFVKAFVLPNCYKCTAFCKPTANPPEKGENVPTKPLTDEEFLTQRKDYLNKG